MADDKAEVANNKESPESDKEQSSERDGASSLESFVTGHYQQQKDEGKFDDTNEIDSDRTMNFFNRAIAESRRMNKEVTKSEAKLTKLHNELGADNFLAWRKEHAAEALVSLPDKEMSHMDL
ncbi:uncharacterized protein [Ptychodera flava]|uniref:uncharacterized protein n=1 Tax=Ptychodera flava TaxID=63121 RepID=UPI003969CA23